MRNGKATLSGNGMQNSEDKLLQSYKREKVCYDRVLELAEKGQEALKAKRPVSEVVSILEEKKRVMREIESIENSIVREKEFYRRRQCRPRIIVAAIDELTTLVERILSIERENEILFRTCGSNVRPNKGMSHVSCEYALTKYTNNG